MHSGLSPLAWGTPGLPSHLLLTSRFIPAGVGNTQCAGAGLLSHPVYPRWRGEHWLKTWPTTTQCGLSPLAWGTLGVSPTKWTNKRFIPAGVGNTRGKQPVHIRSSVYPRWRGEHFSALPTVKRPAGLSPLAWGTLIQRGERRRVGRFIPAGVGNTGSHLHQCRRVPVYPRWRGEHIAMRIWFAPVPGLSPLAWGTRARWSAVLPRRRFIPAGVGNTLKICYYFIKAF